MGERSPQKHRFFKLVVTVIVGGAVVVLATIVVYRLHSLASIEQHKKLIREAGYPTNLEELFAAMPPLEGENRADWILRAHDAYVDAEGDLSDNLFVGGFADDVHRSKPIPPKTLEAMQTYVNQNAAALDILQQSLAYPEARYTMETPTDGEFPTEHATWLQEITYVQSNAAMVAAVERDASETTAALLALFGLPESMRREPGVIIQSNRSALLMMGIYALEQSLNRIDLTDAQLADIATALELNAGTDYVRQALVAERALLLDKTARAPDLWIHLRMNPHYSDNEALYKRQIQVTNFVYQTVGLYLNDLALTLDHSERVVEVAGRPPQERFEAAAALETLGRIIPDRYPIAGSYVWVSASMIRSFLRETATLDAALVAVAAARYRAVHGVYPNSADALVPEFLDALPIDPYGGEPIRYRQLADGFVAYSIAENHTDDFSDEGTNESSWRDGDLTFTVERPE